MTDKLKRAVQVIQEGKTQTGFEMVQEVIKEEPRNADAWYVLAGLVKGEQREQCLRQALQINPDHIQARKALGKLNQDSPADPALTESKSSPAPGQEPADKPSSTPEADPVGETWPGASSYGAPPGQSPREEPAAEPDDRPHTDPFRKQPPGPGAESSEAADQSHRAETAPPDSSRVNLDLPRRWQYTARSKTRLTLITDRAVISADADKDQMTDLEPDPEDPLKGAELIKKIVIPLEAIQKIRQMMSSVRVFYEEDGKEVTVLLDLEDDQAAEEVLVVLRILLGDEFSAEAQPMSPLTALGLSVLYLGIAGGITAFGLWGATEIAAGNVEPRGSALTRNIIFILDLLGPVGVGIIGGILILIALVVSGFLLLNPPTVTILVRD